MNKFISWERVYNIESVGTRIKDSLELAVKLAKSSTANYKHGAILFAGGNVYGMGFNQYRAVGWVHADREKKLEFAKSGIPISYLSLHAEADAIRNIPKEVIFGKNITVVRISKELGLLKNSRPCNMCLQMMYIKGINRCYFSISENKIGCIGFHK